MPRPKPLQAKRRVQLYLHVEDLEWMEREASQRRLPESKSEVVSQALFWFRKKLEGQAPPNG